MPPKFSEVDTDIISVSRRTTLRTVERNGRTGPDDTNGSSSSGTRPTGLAHSALGFNLPRRRVDVFDYASTDPNLRPTKRRKDMETPAEPGKEDAGSDKTYVRAIPYYV